MSWTKKTIILSKLDNKQTELKNSNLPYVVSLLGKVQGQGLNDWEHIPLKAPLVEGLAAVATENLRTYWIRRLDWGDNVILERIIQTKDMSLNDYVISLQFKTHNLPQVWQHHIWK